MLRVSTASARESPTRKKTNARLQTEYANHCGTTNAVNRFKKEFPKLTESTVRGWLTKYMSQLKNTPQIVPQDVQIGTKRGRPLLLPEELDFKLRSFIINLRTAGGTINRHVLYGVLMGLIKSDLAKYGQYLEFHITNGWVQSLYTRMGFRRRIATTSRPKVIARNAIPVS